MPSILKILINFAKKIRNFLTFAVFIFLVLTAIFLWSFSRGSFDTVLQKLGEERNFQILLIIATFIFVVALLLILLSFFETRPSLKGKAGEPLFIKVHKKADRTEGIAGASISLNLLPHAIEETTDKHGEVIIYYSHLLTGDKCDVSVRKSGYISSKSKTIKLIPNERVYLGLEEESVEKPNISESRIGGRQRRKAPMEADKSVQRHAPATYERKGSAAGMG